ncbi:L-lactate permease [Mogibacterium timidum]|uniref:L-lactate permease n=1 Tax=Mogibacterium timidum TaxID=35519 RepID=UPI00248CF320|nr:L-lactate permease [Mogibacterium timidum]
MNIPVNFAMWGMAMLPIIVLIVLMIKFHWGATEAAPVGLLVTILSALTFYKAPAHLVAVESAKGVWSSLVILLIIWTAILLYQAGQEANAFLVIKNELSKLIPNELLLILALGWVFVSFLQGITGFGVPVAVVAPLLIGIGVRPIYAVAIPLLGQAWGNTFGTLGAAWDALADASGLKAGSAEYFKAAFWAAVFLLAWDFITGLIICWFYGKGKAVRKGLPAVLALTAAGGAGELVLSQINTTLSNFIPAVIALVLVMLLGRMKLYNTDWKLEESPIMERVEPAAAADSYIPKDMSLIQAFMPYLLLSVMTFVVLAVKPINEMLGRFKIGIVVPETRTGYGIVNAASDSYSPVAIFTQAGMFLFLAAIIALAYYKSKGWIKTGGTRNAFANSISMTMPSGMAVIGLVIMSKIMGGTGQTIVLSQGIANVLGSKYLLLAPFVGLLGTFMTASNMSSNILFGGFQVTTAQLLHVSAAGVLGAQTAGGAIGAAVSPSKIILGTTTANILGKEGEVLKLLLTITIPATILIGAFLFIVFGL